MLRPVVTCSAVIAVFLVVISASTAFKIEYLVQQFKKRFDQGVASDTIVPIQKRYTEYQNNAIAYCTGSCMYKARLLYGDCYDLCNWNGRAPSPWVRLFQGRSKAKSGVASSSSWQSVLGNRSGRQSTPKKPMTIERTGSQSPSSMPGNSQGSSGVRAVVMGRKKGKKKEGCT